MAKLTPGERRLLFSAYLVLAVGLGLLFFEDGFTPNDSLFVSSFVLLNLAFAWAGIVEMINSAD